MSVTGYERSFYADVQRAADSLEKIAEALDAIRWELKQQRHAPKEVGDVDSR